jgi:hypothetical protein
LRSEFAAIDVSRDSMSLDVEGSAALQGLLEIEGEVSVLAKSVLRSVKNLEAAASRAPTPVITLKDALPVVLGCLQDELRVSTLSSLRSFLILLLILLQFH